jgi:hypothetical protein
VFAIAALNAVQPVFAQATPSPSITSPAAGQVLKGQVPVTGVTDLPNFSSAELAFAYSSDPTRTWFTIGTASLPVNGDVIAVWDTTSVTDGDYTLRLRVLQTDGSFEDAAVNIQVRNYTAAPTPSPTPSPAVTPTETAALQMPTAMIITASDTPNPQAAIPMATPTALPPNPAAVTPAAIASGFWRGALIVGLLVLGFGALVRFRR